MPAVTLHLVSRQLRRRALLDRPGPARHRRDDADRVAGLQRGLLAIEMADVLVVDVHVHEAAQAAVLVEQMAAQIAVLGDQPLENVSNGAPLDFHDVLLAGKRPQRGRDQNPMSHVLSSRSKPVQSLVTTPGSGTRVLDSGLRGRKHWAVPNCHGLSATATQK
jgi:hypothetical protein